MFLSFNTRDLGGKCDYPNIGWIPPSKGKANGELFGEFHEAKYPEIVLFQRDGKWELYLSAMNSGREDSISVAGRTIRLSLFISGTCEEGASILPLINQYIKECLLKSASEKLLQNLFTEKIKHGDPEKWKDALLEMQTEVAQDLLNEMKKFPQVNIANANTIDSWSGGCALSENIDNFIASCAKLLSGEASGMAISLPFLSFSELNMVTNKVKPSESIAILFSIDEDKSRVAQAIARGKGKSPLTSAEVQNINILGVEIPKQSLILISTLLGVFALASALLLYFGGLLLWGTTVIGLAVLACIVITALGFFKENKTKKER